MGSSQSSSQSVQSLSRSSGAASKSSGAASINTGQFFEEMGNQSIFDLTKDSKKIKIGDMIYDPAIKDPEGVKDQGNQRTCYAQAIVTCIRIAQIRNKITPTEPDPKTAYLEMIINQYGKNGGNTQRVLEWITPRLSLKFKTLTTNSRTAEESIKEMTELIKKYLDQGIPALISATWTDGPLTADTKVAKLKQNYHAMVIVDAVKDDWLLQNSWGEQAHANGYFIMDQNFSFNRIYIVFGPKEDV